MNKLWLIVKREYTTRVFKIFYFIDLAGTSRHSGV